MIVDKFYRIEKTVTTSGTAQAIWEKLDYDIALSELFMGEASAIVNENAYSYLGVILDKEGKVLRHEYWHRPNMADPEDIPDPEPEVEPEGE